MTWPVLVESRMQGVTAFVPDLPGFHTSGETEPDALDAASAAVERYVGWLESGELLPEGTGVQTLQVAERLDAPEERRAIFAHDRAPVPDEQFELALAVGRAVVSDLLFVWDDVPQDRRADASRILQHVAGQDRWYASRIAAARESPFHSIEDELIQSASLFEETIDAEFAARNGAFWNVSGEEWSVGKVLRLRTCHLREYLPAVMACLE